MHPCFGTMFVLRTCLQDGKIKYHFGLAYVIRVGFRVWLGIDVECDDDQLITHSVELCSVEITHNFIIYGFLLSC